MKKDYIVPSAVEISEAEGARRMGAIVGSATMTHRMMREDVAEDESTSEKQIVTELACLRTECEDQSADDHEEDRNEDGCHPC